MARKRKIRPSDRTEFKFKLTREKQDREVAEILDRQANASGFVKMAVITFDKLLNMQLQGASVMQMAEQLGDDFNEKEMDALISIGT